MELYFLNYKCQFHIDLVPNLYDCVKVQDYYFLCPIQSQTTHSQVVVRFLHFGIFASEYFLSYPH